MKTLLPCLAFFISCTATLEAQKPVRVPEYHPTSIGGGSGEYKQTPPDLVLLPKGEGARSGRLWIRNTGYALLIVGEVDGPAPDWPRNKNLILAKDHIEVWLAGVAEVPMPPIGWGHQFGEQVLKTEDSCASWVKENESGKPSAERETKCRAWFKEQERYRESFRKLFVRQWLLTEDYSIESFATPAYDRITAAHASDLERYKVEVPEAVKAQGKVQMWWTPAGPRSYSFQIQIPYTAFPPLNTLALHELRLMVDVFSPAPEGRKMGPYSTTSAAREWGRPETFNALELDPPRTFEVTPCRMDLTGTDAYGEDHKAWFIPKATSVVPFERDTFLVVNEARGYAYEPEGLSPIVRPIHDFWHGLDTMEWICGPQLAYRKGETVRRFGEQVDEDGFDAKRLSDGTILIKVGPRVWYSEFGSGQCGACPRTDLRIYALDKNLKLTHALGQQDVVADGSQDYSISQDWLRITRFDQKEVDGDWHATTFCLHGLKYETCEEKDKVKPPDPPLLKELRHDDQE